MSSPSHIPNDPLVRALPAQNHSEAGLTLVECIMAIVVVGVVGAVIAPMMAISVATRVQSQRAEQSLALAQSEIDRVRIMFEQGDLPNDANTEVGQITLEEQSDDDFSTDYWPVVGTVDGDRAASVLGPTGLNDTATTLRAVVIINDPDVPDDEEEPDFIVQSYLVEKDDVEETYEMGVRVYDYDAVANANGALPTNEALLGITEGGRATDNQGDRSVRPKAVLYTNLGATEDIDALCNWIDYTDDAGDAPRPASCN